MCRKEPLVYDLFWPFPTFSSLPFTFSLKKNSDPIRHPSSLFRDAAWPIELLHHFVSIFSVCSYSSPLTINEIFVNAMTHIRSSPQSTAFSVVLDYCGSGNDSGHVIDYEVQREHFCFWPWCKLGISLPRTNSHWAANLQGLVHFWTREWAC